MMRPTRWLLVALVALATMVPSAILPTAAFAAKDKDAIDVAGSASSCCIGETSSLADLSSYWAQSFVALGRRIKQFEFYALDNFGPIFNGPFKFRVLLVEGTPNSGEPKTVLFASNPISVPFAQNGGRFTTISVDMNCARLTTGSHYAWIIDAYSTRDGVLDVGQVYTTTPGDVGYLDGQLYVLNATGLGLKDDLNATWFTSGADMAFHMAFYNDREAPTDVNIDPNRTSTSSGSCHLD